MSYKRAPGRSLEEWMDLVTECRQSGLTDAAWCNEHGISPSCFYNAVTRLRKKACQIPDPVGKASTLDLTSHKQDVVQIAIGPESSPAERSSDNGGSSMHLDNSHTIEIEADGFLIRMSNEIKPAFFLPMYEYFHRKLLERGFAMADETPLQVLHEPERRAQTKSYMWLLRSGEDGGPPIILYKYSETRAGDNAVNFLHGFKGYLMCDGYSGYNKVSDAKRTACWAHIRRYLTDAIPKGKALDYTQPFVQGMLYINQLFHMEDVIKSKYSSFDAIKKARLEKEKPVVEGFLSWLDQQDPTRGSRMDKAVTYIQNRRSYLSTYLEDGRCSFSNDLSENAVRPFTVGRKNWLFCDPPNGAQASAIVYTMVEMAKANGVNVYHYLTYLLEKLPDDRMSDDELELLAPWNETIKVEIERRANESNQSYVNCIPIM